jgi:hypothetical protein
VLVRPTAEQLAAVANVSLEGDWQRVRSEYGDDTEVDALDPSRYTLEFRRAASAD